MDGMLPIAVGGFGLRAFTASRSFARLFLAGASEEVGALDRAAGCSWGLPWS